MISTFMLHQIAKFNRNVSRVNSSLDFWLFNGFSTGLMHILIDDKENLIKFTYFI